MAAAIMRRDARAVSDGSFKDSHGTAAFCLHGDNPTKAIHGCHQTHGTKEVQCPYRSELSGVCGILTMLEGICKTFNLEEGAITIGLDGESVIKTLERPWIPKPTEPHYDLVVECKRRREALPIKVNYRWVEGHQDDAKGARLDWWALQNIRMDFGAKLHWAKTHRNPPIEHKLPH